MYWVKKYKEKQLDLFELKDFDYKVGYLFE